MPQVSTHLLGSTDGYTTQAHSPDLSAPEIRELEDLMHGQAEEPAIRSNLDKRPTALLRRLQSSGRYAISRILAGPQDSTGRETIAVCTIVLDPKAFAQTAAGDMWGLLKAPQLWKIENFKSSRDLSIPNFAPVTRAVTQNDALLFDTWVQSRNTANGLGVIDNAEVFEQALVNLGQVLHPEDRLAYMWGCHLLSPQSPAQLASFANPNVVHRGRRSVVQPSATPQTSQGQTALQSVGKTQLPSSQAKPTPAKSLASAWGDDQGDIGLEGSLTPATTQGTRWSQPKPIAQARPALPMTWLAIGAASLVVLAGAVLFGILQHMRNQPPMPDTQVTATRDNPETVEITWVAGERAATHTVERSQASAAPLSWESLGEQTSPFRDKTGKPGIKYAYRVTSASLYKVPGEASNSAEGVRPPAMPDAITVTGAGKQARIKWDPVQGASKYSVEWVIDARPAASQETSNAWIEIELQPGETLASVKVVAQSSENVPSQPAPWEAGFTQTKTARPDAIVAESIAFECVQSQSGQLVDLRVTWPAPQRCDACTYELKIDSRLTPTSSPTITTVSSPDYTIVGVGKYETVTVSITVMATDTLGNQLSSAKAKAEWSACPLPTDFALKAGTEWIGDSFDVTWKRAADVTYSVKLSDGTVLPQPAEASTATIRVSDKTATEVTLELVCEKPGTCPRSTPPITVKRVNAAPPTPPAEPSFPQAMKDSAENFLKFARTEKPPESLKEELALQIRESVGLHEGREFSVLTKAAQKKIEEQLQTWLACLCGIANERIASSATTDQDLAGVLWALRNTQSRLPDLLRTTYESKSQEGPDGFRTIINACPAIDSAIKAGESRMREQLERRNIDGTEERKKLWKDGRSKLQQDPNAFCKDLLQPQKLKQPDSKGPRDTGLPDRRDLWKRSQYPTWIDLATYACLLDSLTNTANQSRLRNALNEVLKDSQNKENVDLGNHPFFEYALSRVEAKKP